MTQSTETAAAPSRVETEVAKPQVSSVTMGKDGAEAVSHDELSDSLDLGSDDFEQDGAEGGDGAADAGTEGEPEADAPEGEPSADDLPDYDPENDEVRSQYDARYFKDGELNEAALSAEYWKSFEAAGGDVSKSGLSEGAYAYLKDTLGIAKDTVKKLEASLVAKHQADETQFYGKFGGVDRYNRAITWAKAGGYDEGQQQRFRDAFAKGGADRDDAVDALMNRFHRANPPKGDGRRGPPGRRSSSPQRDATGTSTAQSASGGDRFKNANEHRTAWGDGLAAVRTAKETGDKAAIKKAQDALAAISRKAKRGYAQR